MYTLARPFLFRMDPENAHAMTLRLVALAGKSPSVRLFLRLRYAMPRKTVRTFGLKFSNPVGLAAGYDKDGTAWRGLACLGFSHIEVGTVTLRPQPGNPRPRVFRLPHQRALINRMGFPGLGAEFVARQLPPAGKAGVILGVNLGKNKDTPLEEAAGDYLGLLEIFSPLADYLTINVSSPNTIGLRRLQARQALEMLLGQLANARHAQELNLRRRIPVLVKLAPDLTDAELDDALDAILQAGMDGVIATNTTIGRQGLNSPLAYEGGGLSGAPLQELSTSMVRKISQRTSGKLPVIGVGGVMDAESARQKLDAGAVLVQLYTGLIYTGPRLVQQIVRKL